MILSILILAFASVVAAVANFEWDCTNSLAPCENACYSIYCKGFPQSLTYDSNAANRDPRRTASGCNRTPCTNTKYKKFGNSCDEFPFASTKEGGAGANLRCVDSTENSSEGGQLGNFYKKLKDGDQYTVFVRNYGGGPFCESKTCTNDGGEFKLSKGAFVNAKNRRDEEAYFSPEVSSNSTGSPIRRKFMGEDGLERLWLSTDTEGTPVGQEVWGDATGYVKITHEIFD